jgi:hypothetical protein
MPPGPRRWRGIECREAKRPVRKSSAFENHRSFGHQRGGLVSRFGGFGSLFGFLWNETDADIRPIYPDQFAPAKCESGRRQKQEEFSGLQYVNRTLNLKPGTGVGNVKQSAASSPRAIDAHEVYGITVFNSHTACLSLLSCHQNVPRYRESFLVDLGFRAELLKAERVPSVASKGVIC